MAGFPDCFYEYAMRHAGNPELASLNGVCKEARSVTTNELRRRGVQRLNERLQAMPHVIACLESMFAWDYNVASTIQRANPQGRFSRVLDDIMKITKSSLGCMYDGFNQHMHCCHWRLWEALLQTSGEDAIRTRDMLLALSEDDEAHSAAFAFYWDDLD